MSIQQMMLAAKLGTPNMAAATAEDVVYGSGSASASYALGNTGARTLVGNLSGGYDPWWLYPQIGMDQFECYASLVSGQTPSGGTLGVWLGSESTRSWFNSMSGGGGTRSSVLSITIRQKGTTTPTYQANITVTASSFQGDPP